MPFSSWKSSNSSALIGLPILRANWLQPTFWLTCICAFSLLRPFFVVM